MSYIELHLPDGTLEVLGIGDLENAYEEILRFTRKTLAGQLFLHALQEMERDNEAVLRSLGRGADPVVDSIVAGVANGRLDVLRMLLDRDEAVSGTLGMGQMLRGTLKKLVQER